MRKAYLAIICLFTGFNAFAQHTDIQPVPQQISESGQLITLPGSYQFTGDTEANPYAVQQLKQLLAGNHSAKEGLRIYIGKGRQSHPQVCPPHSQSKGRLLSLYQR